MKYNFLKVRIPVFLRLMSILVLLFFSCGKNSGNEENEHLPDAENSTFRAEDFSSDLDGRIGDSEVGIKLKNDNGKLSGECTYQKTGKSVRLNGGISLDGRFELKITGENGEERGVANGVALNPHFMLGTWSAYLSSGDEYFEWYDAAGESLGLNQVESLENPGSNLIHYRHKIECMDCHSSILIQVPLLPGNSDSRTELLFSSLIRHPFSCRDLCLSGQNGTLDYSVKYDQGGLLSVEFRAMKGTRKSGSLYVNLNLETDEKLTRERLISGIEEIDSLLTIELLKRNVKTEGIELNNESFWISDEGLVFENVVKGHQDSILLKGAEIYPFIFHLPAFENWNKFKAP